MCTGKELFMNIRGHFPKRHHLVYELDCSGEPRSLHPLPEGYRFGEVGNLVSLGIEPGSRKYVTIDYMRKASGDKCKGLGIYDGERCIGYGWAVLKGGENCDYRITGSDCYICRCLVDPDYRGQGLFKCLIEEMLRLYCVQGRATAAIRPDNMASRKSFEALGFTVCGERRYRMLCIGNLVRAIPHLSI